MSDEEQNEGNDEDSSTSCSADTSFSPAQTSPVSSPFSSSPPTSPYLSPSTSPIVSSDDSNSSSPIPRKRRRKDTVYRTTAQRRLRSTLPATDSSVESVQSGNSGNATCSITPIRSPAVCPHRACSPSADPEENIPLQGNSVDVADSSSSFEDSGSSRVPDSSDDDVQIPPTSPTSVCSAHSSSSSRHSDGRSDDLSAGENSVHPLYEGSHMTSEESLLKILKLFIEERWTRASLDKNIKLIKSLLPQPNDLPSSGKAALGKLKDLTASYNEIEHTYCNECLELVETESRICDDHSGGSTKFYSFSIQDQIKHMFEQRGLASLIDWYRENRNSTDGYICDIVDGIEYKNVKAQMKNPYDLVLLWYTDGVSLSHSSKQELWPILATICEVPPRLRFSFVCVCGVVVSTKKPNMNVILKPFAESLKHTWEFGIQWTHPTSKIEFCSQVVAPVFSADAPARAMVVRCKNYNSRYGCNNCEQKSRKVHDNVIRNENNLQDGTRKTPRCKRRFLFEEDTGPPALRTGHRMNEQGNLAELRGKSRKGVTGKAVISEIPLLDRALCISAEYMHLILLGVVKYLLNKIFFMHEGPWFLGDKLDEINQFIASIKVPDFVKRLPRGISDFKFWKASEFRAFLLFYLLPIFKDYLPDEYFQHWILLVGAVHILLQDNISENDLLSADIMIRSFVRDVGPLYGNDSYTYNMHTLLHVPLLVRRWGPLWATSAFLFESFLGFLSNHAHGTKNVGKELVNIMKISQGIAIFENIVNNNPERRSNWSLKLGVTEFLGKPASLPSMSLDNQEREILSELGVFLLYKRAKIKSEIFTSKSYDKNMTRANSFVRFKPADGRSKTHPQYGQIIVFAKAGASFYCLIKVFKVVHVNLFFHESSRFIVKNLLPVEYSGELVLLPVENLITKVLKIGMYVELRPNSIEVNL